MVHVKVDKIPWQECGNVHLTRAIEHPAITEKMMLRSGLVLAKENVDAPESSIEAYRNWAGQKKHEIMKEPLQKGLLTESYALGPMICNFFPTQT